MSIKNALQEPEKARVAGIALLSSFVKMKITYFVYGYQKNEKDDLSDKEQRDYKERATDVLSSSDAQIQARKRLTGVPHK